MDVITQGSSKTPHANSEKNKLLARYGKHPAYRNFISSLKAPATKIGYSFALSKYLNSKSK